MSNQRPPANRSTRLVSGAILVSVAAVAGTIVWTQALAAVYQGPTVAPPGGNIPVTIWNRLSSTEKQTGAAIDIDGGGPAPTSPVGISVGSTSLDFDAAAGGENLFYGVAPYASMNAGDSLLLLQTYAPSIYTTRLSVDRAGNLDVSGRVHGAGCMGKVFVGLTSTGGGGGNGIYSVSAIGGSYYAANAKCAADFPGSHVCRSEEILESISCSAAGDPIRDSGFSGVPAWINGGPPGYAAMANDCIGWQSSAVSAYGRVWIFDAVTGGYGTQTTCNTSPGLNIACCK